MLQEGYSRNKSPEAGTWVLYSSNSKEVLVGDELRRRSWNTQGSGSHCLDLGLYSDMRTLWRVLI